MATVLEKDKKIRLNFTPGTILTVEPTPATKVTKAPASYNYALVLYSKKGDILLHIEFSTGRIILTDRAHRSLGDGWGKRQIVDMTRMKLKGRSVLEVKVSIHHSLTDSEFERYQILLDGKTISHFETRFPGPATEILYLVGTAGPPSWDVDVYQIDDLLPEERLALGPERPPSPPIPSLDSIAISIQPSHFVPTQTYASLIWDHGKEIRLYYLGPGNVLHEYAHSASKGKNSWYYGNLEVVLNPTSSIAVIRLEDDDTTCIYYQDPSTNFIRMISQHGPVNPWKEAPPIVKAVKGSSFAVVRSPNLDANKIVSRIYYQDPELYLKESYYSPLVTTDQWVAGDFNPGVQPQGTPITVEVVQGGIVDINVIWRDTWGRVASSSWSKWSGWELPNPNDERAPHDG